jgi:hypothetical protein
MPGVGDAMMVSRGSVSSIGCALFPQAAALILI